MHFFLSGRIGVSGLANMLIFTGNLLIKLKSSKNNLFLIQCMRITTPRCSVACRANPLNKIETPNFCHKTNSSMNKRGSDTMNHLYKFLKVFATNKSHWKTA